MKHFFRPYSSVGLALLLGTGAWAAIAPAAAQARAGDGPLAASGQPVQCSSSQGYLGVDLADVDPQKAQALKLKEVRGALITLIDHDAPACKSGLRVNDVVVQLNGQRIEGAMQLRRMLREIPAGRKVTLAVSRDGRLRTLVVELADRSVVEHDAWNRIGSDGDPGEPSPGTTADKLGRTMVWSETAGRYMRSFEMARRPGAAARGIRAASTCRFSAAA